MKNQINIAEILEDCPKGTKLYSPLFGDCIFREIDNSSNFEIVVEIENDEPRTFDVFGRYFSGFQNSECMLFPSKDNRDWSTFQKPFEDGDILTYTGHYTTTFIYRHKEKEPNYSTSFYVACNNAPYHNFLIYNKYTLIALNGNCDVRFATEEEKQKLFNAIKANGYKWNEENKTLEKLVEPKFKYKDISLSTIGYKWNEETKSLEKLIKPKFKVGDRIVEKSGFLTTYVIKSVSDKYYGLELPHGIGVMPIKHQDDWELVPDKFDITTLKPFDKVLARCSTLDKWRIQLFEKYDRTCKYPFICMGYNKYKQCIPYEGNEHLLDTTDDCDDFYKL